MTRTQNEALRYAYEAYKKGNTTYYILYDKIANDKLTVLNALKELDSKGYIQLEKPAIGAAYVTLTEYGVSYCEEHFA